MTHNPFHIRPFVDSVSHMSSKIIYSYTYITFANCCRIFHIHITRLERMTDEMGTIIVEGTVRTIIASPTPPCSILKNLK